ncbi:MAG: NAD-dependent epimerase/dehydratase family protein [Parcubacteria group bacterium]|nr:NAD-dependent epimerase/dehydratase family protein [Parcubacteria group bacterium]
MHTIFLTGAAGYVGGMLADQFSKRPDVKQIICLDKREQPESLKGNEKIVWFTANTAGNDWQGIVRWLEPTIVIHCAWQIREMYGKQRTQWLWNVEGSQNVFDFAFDSPSVQKLIHFSTASSYGAFSGNTLEHHFTETEHFRENEYLYGIEKRVAEERLRARFVRAKSSGATTIPKVYVVRPAAITGPRGRVIVKRFGLQSVLKKGLPIIPIASATWCRQFIHEDDVTDIIAKLSFEYSAREYNVFNITPDSVVLAHDMAEVMGKRTFRITPLIVRVCFFILWHLSRGRIPTSKGGWKFYSYPIVLDGSKITRELGYEYRWQSRAALEKLEGRYAEEALKIEKS